MEQFDDELTIQWSAIYQREWDDTPMAYIDAGLVSPGRSRRLALARDAARSFKAYLGVYHTDPTRWGREESATARCFISLFYGGRSLGLHSHLTMGGCLTELYTAYAALRAQS